MASKHVLRIGFSPCPNDTFIFDALINQRVESEFEWLPELEDVETLNTWARSATLDVTKLSFGAYAFVSDQYQILSSGSALGMGCGPLLISKSDLTQGAFADTHLYIPGQYTTAHLLLNLFYPQWKSKQELVFSEIESALLQLPAAAGLIIHESRFTYAGKGLQKLVDLGEKWEQETGLPIPLGCIVVRRSLPEEVKARIAREIRNSVEYAFAHPEASAAYVQAHAQEMERDVQARHIALYVNEFSVDLGEAGKAAITALLHAGVKSGLLPEPVEPMFVHDSNH